MYHIKAQLYEYTAVISHHNAPGIRVDPRLVVCCVFVNVQKYNFIFDWFRKGRPTYVHMTHGREDVCVHTPYFGSNYNSTAVNSHAVCVRVRVECQTSHYYLYTVCTRQ